MPAPDRPRHIAETRYVASLYRRARDVGSGWDQASPSRARR